MRLSINGTKETAEELPFQPVGGETRPLHNKWRSTIFGPFWGFARGTLVVNDCGGAPKPSNSKTSTIIRALIFVLVGAPILIRTIYLITTVAQTYFLSLNWAFAFALTLISAHGFVSLVTLYILSNKNFFDDFIKKFLLTIKNKVSSNSPFRKAFIFTGLFSAFFLYAVVYYAVENVVMIEDLHFNVSNSSAKFRQSFLGTQELFPVDVLIMIWGVFVSVTALALYNLCANSICSEYTKYNDELKEACKNGHLQHADLLTNYGARQLDFLELARFSNSHWEGLTTFTFMVGALLHVTAGLAFRGFGEELQGISKLAVFNFMLLSIFLLVICMKRPGDIYNQVQDTKNTILFERTIWNQSDEKLFNAANNIVNRIVNADYVALAFHGFKITEKFFHRTLPALAIIIEILNLNKVHVP